MKILVIGGAGYIGSHVALAFQEEEAEVGIFDDLSTGVKVNIQPGMAFHEGNILDKERLNEVMSMGWDGIVHLAAKKAAGESMLKPELYSENNLSGTLNILAGMTGNGIQNIVFSSSAAVYGEPEYQPLDEEHPKKPINYYGFTKLKIEEIMSWYHQLKGLSAASLRYFNACGYDAKGRIMGLEKNPANLLPVAMEAAVGMREKLVIFGNDYPTKDGTCIRDYIHVTDLASAHVLAMKYIMKAPSELAVNLGTTTGYSVREIVEKALEVTGVDFPVEDGPIRPGDPASLIASSQKARDILGWEPKHSDLRNLLETTWDVYEGMRKE